MKTIVLVLLAVTLQSCNGQEKNKTEESKIVITPHKSETSKESETSINFLDTKYQSGGFSLPDNPNPYPTYSYSDKKTGIFTVDYIGKKNDIQYFWNFNNKNGYFANYENIEDRARDSKTIQNFIYQKDYYIIASYLPSKYISYLGENGEFDLKPNAKTTFYLNQNNKWKWIGEIETSKIPEDILSFDTNLLQKDIFENVKIISNVFDGSHSVSVETEATTTGMASISYEFIINKNDVTLSLNSYKENNLCEGKYIGIEKNNQLEIYYLGDQLSCVSIEPKFTIKKDKDQFYIKGIGGEGTYNKWVPMK
ncbi:hypothetical protein [Chryseobacterium herbae]|uniref:Lipoprotein n=1 Tax=Chryseobacterium herbae TaxID=2976476 RepID=A0ABT2IQ03_9FLAO|nr:hypothetical protein [Chryseobacterium sp. pc1-10]MCT2560903.1 hypothetical protein [Chryseobacterium sp. pc1-10]